jgi:PHD/YefM family antitoxin component YafN of YafNO toxin-antitoxin module
MIRRYPMRMVEAKKAKIPELLAESEKSHEPIHIVGKKNAGILLSFDDWRAIQETLYLLSIPKMRESIVRGLKTPVEKCSPELTW